jgi:hypothetical protein
VRAVQLRAAAGLAVAVAAAALLIFAPARDRPAPAGPVTVGLAAAWPGAARADIPGNLPDGPIFTPLLFLDARTAVGTAPSPDAGWMRLLIRRADGRLRELRRLPLDKSPSFDNLAAAGDDLVWTESMDQRGVRIWSARLSGGAARLVTADTGDALFYGSQYDLTVADGQVHWTAAAGQSATAVRSVPLAGGTVQVRTEPGQWGLSAWPWLTDGAGSGTGTTRLRNLATGRDRRVQSTGVEIPACGPAWCRVMVMGDGGLVRIDVMHPDGSARSRIAGSTAGAAVPDVAILDRFEILSETGPDSALTGTAGLAVYDIGSRRTITVSAAVSGAFARGGVLWWSTGGLDDTVWHTIDLRTV